MAPEDRSKNEKHIYYIGIEDPKDLQKEVLSAAKGTIVTLKNYEKLKHGRKEKVELFSKLKQDVQQINHLLGKLNTLMPETKLRHLPHREKKEEKKPEPKKETKPKEKKKAKKPVQSELEKLENELQMIESKLSGI
ncbi:MAG: hypothetical protein R6V53_00640 [Candidatus Woesearchaeota archaeon]